MHYGASIFFAKVLTIQSTYCRIKLQSTHCRTRSDLMSELQMGVIESKFADIIWQNEPVATTELVKLSEKELNWKKTTTYTVLKRLCDKGIFRNDKGTVTSLISKNEFYSVQSEKFVDETFGGSLPAFLAAFTARKALTREEVEELRRMVADFEEE